MSNNKTKPGIETHPEQTGLGSDLREMLADHAHDAWSRWMKHLFSVCQRSDNGTVLIPTELVAKWNRQVQTPYANLSEMEKKSDRAEADKVIALLERNAK